MRQTCILIAATFAFAALAPGLARASDPFDADAAFLGEIDTSRAPPVTRKSSSALGVDGQLAFARELSRKGLPAAALPFLRHAAREAPGRADVWLQLAGVLEAVHRKEEAERAFDRYLSLTPGGAYGASPEVASATSRTRTRTRATPPPPTRGSPVIYLPEPLTRSSDRPAAKPALTTTVPVTRTARTKTTVRGRTVVAQKPAGPPPNRKQINGMLEQLGEL